MKVFNSDICDKYTDLETVIVNEIKDNITLLNKIVSDNSIEISELIYHLNELKPFIELLEKLDNVSDIIIDYNKEGK